jgi:hypothetical protein
MDRNDDLKNCHAHAHFILALGGYDRLENLFPACKGRFREPKTFWKENVDSLRWTIFETRLTSLETRFTSMESSLEKIMAHLGITCAPL